jgi:hypothetical protein
MTNIVIHLRDHISNFNTSGYVIVKFDSFPVVTLFVVFFPGDHTKRKIELGCFLV